MKQRSMSIFAATLALLLAGSTARAQQANYKLPAEPTAKVGSTYFYAVPLGYIYDHFSYIGTPGDWNVAIGDSGFDAGEIPGNPTFCSPNGDMCPNTAGGPASTSFLTINNDPTHTFTGIPLLIGPTQDGFNNVQIGFGQSIPVVPGKYVAAYITYAGVNGPHQKLLAPNYTDTTVVKSVKWADWCAPSQASPDFFTWAPRHRHNGTGIDNASCALITKYVPLDPNRTLTSITVGMDNSTDRTGLDLPGETIGSGNGRTVIGSLTLVSADPSLGGYGLVSGHVTDSAGNVQTTPGHAHTPDAGYDVFVMGPALGNYGAGANVDGSYTIGLPAGTYVLSAAVRDGGTTSAGPQATPVTVTVTAGKTTVQDIKLLASPNPSLWGEVVGVVKDAAGNPVQGAAILVSASANGPFAAVAIPETHSGTPNFTSTGDGTTLANGSFDLVGLDATRPLFLKAAGNGFASASPTMVTLKGGAAVTQNLSVVSVPVGNIAGTVVTPDGQFGGIGIPVTLSSRTLTLTTTTLALPPLAGTGRVPETNETATFEFDGIPAGDYVLSLTPSAAQGKQVDMALTIASGQTAKPTLMLTLPDWNEGAAGSNVSDPLTGATLNSKWTAADIGATSTVGSAKPGSGGLTVTADGRGWDQGADDAFNYVYQTIPSPTAANWVAYVTVTAVPTKGSSASSNTAISPGGQAGLMVASPTQAQPRMANFTISDTNGQGVVAQGRQADGANTFPFGQTAGGTDASNGGTQPGLPMILKLRKVGANFAGFYSTDGGKTQHFIGLMSPQFDPAQPLLLGLATTSNTDGTADTAVYQNFVYATLP